jgi:prepilin peptidase CpaA
MLAQSAFAATWLMLGALPVAAWVVWTDLATMRIPNKAVLALIGVYAVIGALTLPLTVWAWSWLHLVVMLVAGFLLSLTGGFGAGDAKFAAAMAPFVALGDVTLFCLLLTVMAIATFIAHRMARQVPAIRAAAPGWASWERREFPFGVALAPTLIVYLALAAVFGS